MKTSKLSRQDADLRRAACGGHVLGLLPGRRSCPPQDKLYIIGVDIMLDSEPAALLEVNHNPSFTCDTEPGSRAQGLGRA